MMGNPPDRNQVFDDYAAFLHALLPQAVGFLFHDRRGQLFWSDESPDTSQLNADHESVLRRTLMHGELPGDDGRVPLDTVTAYVLRVATPQGRLMGVMTALVPRDMGTMPFRFCADMLAPALRSLSREMSLRMNLLDATSKLKSHGTEREFFVNLSKLGRAGGRVDTTLETLLELTRKQLLLDGAVLLVPDYKVRVSTGPDPVDPLEAEMLLESMQDFVTDMGGTLQEALAQRPAPDPRERTRTWPIIEGGRRLVGILVLSRPANSAKLDQAAAGLADVVVTAIESVLESGFDTLTGLSKWPAFEQALEQALADTSREYCVMYMDIDQLQGANDTYGRPTGDQILRHFAELLRSRLGKHELTRIAGDTFAALLPDVSAEEAQGHGTELCRALRELTCGYGDNTFHPTVSIGVAPLIADEHGAQNALLPAQVACRAAKDRGQDRCELYVSTDASIVRRLDDISLVGSIRSAIEGGRLVLYGQPLERLTGRSDISYHEILVRMLDANGKAMEPAEFMGAAERYQLMQELDRWVLSTAIDTLAEKRADADGRPLHFAINLSGQSLGSEAFLGFVRDQLRTGRVEPARLRFEITETVAVANLGRAQAFMEELRALGCRFSLDDFGTGLSSFAYLKLFPVDTLKIDGGFIKDIVENEVSQSMVAAITEIARVMKLQTVAEYVQSERILAAVRDIGVDWAQGFHIGEPIRLRELVGDGTLTDMAELVDIDTALIRQVPSDV